MFYWVHDESESKGIAYTEDEIESLLKSHVDLVSKTSWDSRIGYNTDYNLNNKPTNKAQSAGVTTMFLAPMNEQDLGYEGFFDGTQEIVPDETVLNCVVIDGFNGIEEGKAQSVCFINVSITTPGAYFGFKFKYNAKIYDNNASKRDQAMKNLGLLDAQAGFPLTKEQLELSTENINQYWSMTSEAQVKIGMMIQKENIDGSPILDENGDPTTRSMNFVRGFGYLREKMRKLPQQQTQQPATQQAEPNYQQPEQTQPVDAGDDIDF